MGNDETKQAVSWLLKECVTKDTVWSRHLEGKDEIAVWQELRRILKEQGMKAISYDDFYYYFEKFKTNQKNDFPKAVDHFVSSINSKRVITQKNVRVQKEKTKPRSHIKKKRTGEFVIEGELAPSSGRFEHEPIKITMSGKPEDWEKFIHYFDHDHEGFDYDFTFNFLSPIENELKGKLPRGRNKRFHAFIEPLKLQSTRIYVVAFYWFKKSPEKWQESFSDLVNKIIKLNPNSSIMDKQKCYNAKAFSKLCMSLSYMGGVAKDYGLAIEELDKDDFYRTYVVDSLRSVRHFFYAGDPEGLPKNPILRQKRITEYTDKWVQDLHIRKSKK